MATCPLAKNILSRRHCTLLRHLLCGLLLLPSLFGCNESAKAGAPFEIRIGVDADKPGRNVNRLVLGSNVQWVDYGDELLDHATGEFDAAMLDKVKAMGPTILRYPGGSLADVYHWKDGVGASAQRGANEHFFSHVKQKVVMGTQEFLELCEAVGAQPLITVNTATGTPEEAASWVALVNQTGLKSRKTGKPLSKVRLWEIGNEPYLQDEGHKSLWIKPEAFGNKASQIIRAMKAVDPTIQVGIPLRSDRLGRFPATPYPGFNEKALKSLNVDFDFVSLHNAYLPLAVDKNYDDDALYLGAVAATASVHADFEATRQLLKRLFPSRSIKLAVTEYNALFSLGGKSSDSYIATITGALVVADLLREFALADDLEFANYWSLSGNWYFGAISNDGKLRPAYYVLQLYRQALQGRLAPVRVETGGFDVPDVGLVPAAKGLPLTSAIATVDGNKVRLIVLNKDKQNTANATITLAGAVPYSTAGYTLLGSPGYFDANAADEKSWLKKGALSGGPHEWKFAVPAHSIVLLEFSTAAAVADKKRQGEPK